MGLLLCLNLQSMGTTEKVWNQFSDGLLHYVKSKTNRLEDAEDLLQDVFIKVHTYKHQLNDEQKLNGWVLSITKNVLVDYYKAKATPLPKLEEGNDSDLDKVIEKCLMPFINELPEKYREAILLSEIEGMPQKELAVKLGVSYSGAKSRVQRGREMLRQAFVDCCNFQVNGKGQYVGNHAGIEDCPRCD